MSTLYIHIGMPKTGTTAIQNFLMDNAERLQKNGLCFPYIDLKMSKEKYKFRRNGNFLVYRSTEPTEEEREKRNKEIFQKGFEILAEKAKEYENILISDEAIWYRQNENADFWEEVLEAADKINCQVKVIAYLRRQDLYAQAMWNQNIKFYPRITMGFEEYIRRNKLKNHNLNYYEKLSEIAQKTGKENLIVRRYEKEIFLNGKTTIYKDFLNAISMEMKPEYVIPEQNFNQNLSGNFIEIKRIINECPAYQESEDFLNEPLIRASNIGKMEKESFFAYDEQLAFMEQYRECNENVAKIFLGEEEGELFHGEIEKLPMWQVHPERMYADLITVFTEITVMQKKEIESLSRKLSWLERSEKKRVSYWCKYAILKVYRYIKGEKS